MSVRLIARDLYRLYRAVARLENLLQQAPSPDKERLEAELRKARAEYQRVKQALDGHKQT